jgi:hypothetical protein
MSGKIQSTAWITLEATKTSYPRDEHGNLPVTQFRVSALRQNRPTPKRGEIAVRLNVEIDPAIFESVVPVVNLSLDTENVILPSVEIEAQGDDSE